MPRATTSDGVEIAYDVEGSGPPVLLVHGITEGRRLWRPVIDRLSDEHRCIALDLRGHGDSSGADDYGALAMAQDVAAVAAAETDGETPAVVGHSLGGLVATVFAAAAPVRAVVNVDQALRLADFAALLRPMEATLRGEGFPAAMAALWEALGEGAVPEDVGAELRSTHERARQEVVLGVWDTVFTSSDEELTAIVEETLLPNVKMPYLAIHGSDPGPGYAAWLTSLVPSAEVEVWDGATHWLHLVGPDRFVERVRGFLRRAGSPAAA